MCDLLPSRLLPILLLTCVRLSHLLTGTPLVLLLLLLASIA